jgi:hypothetical protein
MSKPSASVMSKPQLGQFLALDTGNMAHNDQAVGPQPKPYVAWEDTAAYASVAWFPQADLHASRKLQAKRFVIGSVLAVLGMVTLAAAARSSNIAPVSECRVSEPPVAFGANSETQMLVRGGLPCPIWTRIAGASVNELTVTVAPTNGTITPRGRTGVSYRPSANYRGSDVFEFAMRGNATSTVRVKVTVE